MYSIDIKNFSINNKNQILNEEGKICFWSIYDFAYKKRVHIYDSLNNEIGYVQYKIISTQNDTLCFDLEDKLIDMNGFKAINKKDNWTYDITYNDKSVATVVDGRITIEDSSIINKCILFIFSLAEERE